jgi:hypothetical protein
MTANKSPGILATLRNDHFFVYQSVKDDGNVLRLGPGLSAFFTRNNKESAWHGARSSGARRRRRLAKVAGVERRWLIPASG